MSRHIGDKPHAPLVDISLFGAGWTVGRMFSGVSALVGRHAMRDAANRVGAKYCAPCKGGDFQWVQFPPSDGSVQSVAVGTEEEVTNPSKPLMERIALGDSASMPAET